KMPGMDGLALLAEIRTRRPDTPTLIITGHGESELVVRALRGGACDFIPKPIDRGYFIAALHRAMASREARRRVKEPPLAPARRPDTPTLMITGHGESDLVVGALRGGACDFIPKPIDREYFIAALHRAMASREARRRIKDQRLGLERHLRELEAIVEDRSRERRQTAKVGESPLSLLQGSSGQMEQIVQQIRQVADSPLTVLVQGETGTGKELVARAIHQLSARRDKPFVAVDCGAIPDTLIESELFGYEKGAFTGAHQRKEGQFQRAEGGSL